MITTKPTIEDFIGFFSQLPTQRAEPPKMHAWSELALRQLLGVDVIRVHSNGEMASIVQGIHKETFPLQPDIRLFCQQEIVRWAEKGGISAAQSALELAKTTREVKQKLPSSHSLQ